MIALSSLVLAASALAPGDSQTWNFDITISGDTTWTSPTSVDPGSLAYDIDFTIAEVDVTVLFLGIPITVDAIDLGSVDPELLSGFANVEGPAPITFIDIPILVETPPDPPTIDLLLNGGLDAGGFGFVSATDVSFGTIEVDTGFPFGVQTLPIDSIRIAGSIAITETQWIGLANGLPDDVFAGPLLRGEGVLLPNTPLTLSVERAAVSAPTTLVVGFGNISAPFKGGVLVPSPDLLIDGLSTDVNGELVLPAIWPAGIPSGFSVYLQAWSVDASGPKGLTATNGLSGTAQ